MYAPHNLGLLFFPKGKTIGQPTRLIDAASDQYDVTAIKSTKDGKVWIFVAHRGLYAYNYKTRALKLVNAGIKSASCMEATGGYLWIGSDEGVTGFNISSNTVDKFYDVANRKLKYNSVAGITAGKNNELWVATDGGGVVILNTQTGEAQFLSNTKVNLPYEVSLKFI